MTSPITVMEWPGSSWLHTGAFSHSHSPPVQRRRQDAFQTLISLVCLLCNILPSESMKSSKQQQAKSSMTLFNALLHSCSQHLTIYHF